MMQRTTKKSPQKLPADFDSLVRLYPPRAISDEVEYENMQEMIDALTCLPRRSTGQADYLNTLAILFAAYETQMYPIDTKDLSPVDMLKHLMQDHQLNASDLGRLLGERSLGPKILQGHRGLSKAHIRKLADYFGVSTDLFV